MNKKAPKDILELKKQNICYISEITEDSVLIEISNIGREIAFNVSLSGPWPEYEDYLLKDMSANKKNILFLHIEKR
jgi:hypothetical protein